jgi:hypothetical protein
MNQSRKNEWRSINLESLEDILKEIMDCYPYTECTPLLIGGLRRDLIKAIGFWLGQHRHPLWPYPGTVASGQMDEEQWHNSQIARQTQIDELLAEIGLTKFDVIPLTLSGKVTTK